MFKGILVFLFFATVVCASNCVGKNDTQRNLLMNLYSTTGGLNWTYNYPGLPWNKTKDYCGWAGVTCKSPLDVENCDQVIALTLYNFSMDGYLPSDFSELSLEYINFSINPKLKGVLPMNLFQNMPIKYLYLYKTGFEGVFPKFLSPCPLNTIDISETKFRTINIQECGLIQEIMISNTKISSFSNKKYIYSNLISFIGFSSSFNKEGLPLEFFCDQPKLQTLDLSNNNYNGSIPLCLGNLTTLQILKLNKNKFTNFPPTNDRYSYYHQSYYTNLTFLDLSYNQISEYLDPLMKNYYYFPSLIIGIISHNNFSGVYSSILYNHNLISILKWNNNPVSGNLKDGTYYTSTSLSLLDLRNTLIKITKTDMELFMPSADIYVKENTYFCPILIYNKPSFSFPINIYVSSSYYGIELCQ
jgi:hypothetical protein